MNEWNSNNKRYLNGYVKPQIVLHSDAEMNIAQNAHNLVWERNRREYDALASEIKTLKDSGADHGKASKQWDAMHESAEREINELIVTEIATYRNIRANNPMLHIEERLDQIVSMLDEIRDTAEEARDAAEDAESMIDEIRTIAEAAHSTAEEALSAAESADND